MEINWEKYLDLYPDRYIKKSKIDKKLKELLKQEIIDCEILDIGANKGTETLKETESYKHAKLYFLDPFINKPEWYHKKISWEELFKTKQKFDIIIAKNSLNYLTEKELSLIPKILKDNGTFIANTFIHPKEINREFINSKTGTKGREKTVFKRGKIYHYLHINGNIIEHSFYYYDIYKLIEIFKKEKLTFEITSPSSMIIKLKK